MKGGHGVEKMGNHGDPLMNEGKREGKTHASI